MIDWFCAELDEEGAGDRGHDAGGADGERIEQHRLEHVATVTSVCPAKKIAASTMVATMVTA